MMLLCHRAGASLSAERLKVHGKRGRAALSARATGAVGESGGQPLYPLPQSTREMVREASAAVLRCGAAGNMRQRLELLMPTNCRAKDFTDTEDLARIYLFSSLCWC